MSRSSAATSCAFNYPGLRWISSYWDREQERVLCIYEADSAEQIAHHSMRARIPCDRIFPVDHIDPAAFAGGHSLAPRADAQLV